ncbi:hypothetical protein SEA_MUFASA8_67 [Arthrobacter phage Mufasa8]|uniref:Uncharacterized protein n=1 Tax=Arthrobacter phage Mufasa8 TaxID=2656526 RepID=A0A649VN63_9CAUD|nr:hypothetical protein HYQ08_gp067 [Arthrobacter phage Mufasa8]QGJ93515.1 hypothetical protein SEA_MUFASA8_67 [Arthrobacter phage Mufasa8]
MPTPDQLAEFHQLVQDAHDASQRGSNDAEIQALQDAVECAESLLEPTRTHSFTGTVKRADGITVTATITVPEGHKAVSPEPTRPWHGKDRTNQNFLELGELAMMVAQQGYGIVERNERHREEWGKQDYWADLLNIPAPTPQIEAGK